MSPEVFAETLAAIDVVMTEAGYEPMGGSLMVGGIPFEVEKAFRADEGFLDLVVVLDGTDDSESQASRNYWLVERIASALDQAESRRPLTAIIIHEIAGARVPIEEYLRLARILLVSGPHKVREELAPILPLVLEPTSDVERDPLTDLEETFASKPDSAALTHIIGSARGGSGPVSSAFAEWLDEAFEENRSDVGDSS